jgi:prolipoprotein diacylglyceryltransferase
VIPAVIQLSFDPVLHLGDSASVRLATVALALVLFLAILFAAWIAARTPADGPYVPPPSLRPDDLLFIAVGAVPGAVIAGRVGYALLHADFYLAHPAAIADPSQGSLSLSLVPLGGLLSAIVIVRLIEAPLGRWMHVATLPTLFRLAGVLSAAGQGAPSDLDWATAYDGPGPWDSLAPGLPSHPSQAYEGLALLVVLVVLGVALARGAFAKRDGRVLLFAIASWAAVRAVVAATWRDDLVLGPLRAEQLIDLAVMFVCLVAVSAFTWRGRASTPRVAHRQVQWPDPGQRPRF